MASFDQQKHRARFDLDGIRFQIDACGSAQRFSGREIESSVVLWTFDDMACNEPICQQSLLVGTQPIGGKIAIIGGAKDGKAMPSVIKAEDVFGFNFINSASRRPI